MDDKPMDRTHQEKIARLKQEMAVIKENLELQAQIFGRILQDQASRVPSDGMSRPNHGMDYTQAGSRAGRQYHTIQNVGGLDPELKLSATDPNGFRELLAQACSEIACNKLQRFHELDFNASDLERRVRSLHS